MYHLREAMHDVHATHKMGTHLKKLLYSAAKGEKLFREPLSCSLSCIRNNLVKAIQVNFIISKARLKFEVFLGEKGYLLYHRVEVK